MSSHKHKKKFSLSKLSFGRQDPDGNASLKSSKSARSQDYHTTERFPQFQPSRESALTATSVNSPGTMLSKYNTTAEAKKYQDLGIPAPLIPDDVESMDNASLYPSSVNFSANQTPSQTKFFSSSVDMNLNSFKFDKEDKSSNEQYVPSKKLMYGFLALGIVASLITISLIAVGLTTNKNKNNDEPNVLPVNGADLVGNTGFSLEELQTACVSGINSGEIRNDRSFAVCINQNQKEMVFCNINTQLVENFECANTDVCVCSDSVVTEFRDAGPEIICGPVGNPGNLECRIEDDIQIFIDNA